jgi:hypothetical protein
MPKVPGIRNPRSDNTAPTVPTNLVATTLSTTSISLTWTASTDAGVGVAGYQVWRDYAPIAVRTVTNYTDSGLEPSTPYEYHVSAYDANGNMSGLSLPSSATTDDAGDNADPVWQTIAQQELTTGTNFSLPLGSFVTDPEGLAITIAQVSGTLPTGVTLNTSTKIVSGTPTVVLASSSVVFRATDLEGAFADKTVVFNCLAPDTTAPSVPTNLAGTAFSRQRIDLTWTASTDTAGTNERSSGLSGYKLYRDGALRATLGLVTSYSDTGLATGTTYSYRLSAFDVALNESAQCTAVPVATTANSAPEWVTPADLGMFDYPVTFDITMRLLAFDDDGDPITYSYDVPLPAGFALTELTNPLGALLTISSSATEATHGFTAYADDGSNTAEQDWLTRSTGSGVVWAHDFREAGELTAFLADPTGSGNVSLQSAGFGSGGYLRYTIPKGIPDGKYFVPADASSGAGWLVVDGATLPQPADGQSNAQWTWAAAGTLSVGKGTWQRPFTALVAGTSGGNGKATPDAAAAGTLTRRTLTSTSASNYSTLRAGYYGHSSYQSQTWNLLGGYTANSASWDGTDFWIQYRVRISASRFGSLTNPDRTYNQYRYPNGKLAAVMTNYITPAQAIVVQSLTHDPRVNHSTAEFGMYMHSAQSSFVALTYPPNMPNLSAFQPGGEYDPPSTGQCRWDNSGYYVRNCWEWPADEWVTVLMHIIPGRDNTGLATENTLSTAPYRDTGIQVWVARENALNYTSLWDVVDDGSGTGFPFFFLDGSGQVHPPAWNMFIPWAYMNNAPALQPWTQDFTQIIFKKGNGGTNPTTDGIPCPQI